MTQRSRQVDEGAERLLALLQKPLTDTGKFWFGEEELEF